MRLGMAFTNVQWKHNCLLNYQVRWPAPQVLGFIGYSADCVSMWSGPQFQLTWVPATLQHAWYPWAQLHSSWGTPGPWCRGDGQGWPPGMDGYRPFEGTAVPVGVGGRRKGRERGEGKGRGEGMWECTGQWHLWLTHVRMHACTHACTHTHTHTQTLSLSLSLSLSEFT